MYLQSADTALIALTDHLNGKVNGVEYILVSSGEIVLSVLHVLLLLQIDEQSLQQFPFLLLVQLSPLPSLPPSIESEQPVLSLGPSLLPPVPHLLQIPVQPSFLHLPTQKSISDLNLPILLLS